jgi:hypothetical protein
MRETNNFNNLKNLVRTERLYKLIDKDHSKQTTVIKMHSSVANKFMLRRQLHYNVNKRTA